MYTRRGKDLILIVEDDQDVADMLCAFLRTKQYRLVTTPMGGDVLEICQREHPSLILLDINLPDIDGYQVCRCLRENLSTSNLPIIFLTQNKLREDRLAGLDGGDDYITKPFDVQELYLRVSNVLRRAKHRAGMDQVSGLPTGPLIETQLKELLRRDDWAVLLISVEGFERFERAYWRFRDQFVHYVGQLARQAVDEVGNFEDFVGRVEAVKFIVITTPPRLARLQKRMTRTFARVMDPPTENSGNKPITAHLSLSFGVVTDKDGPYGDVRSLAEAVAQSHTMARRVMGMDE